MYVKVFRSIILSVTVLLIGSSVIYASSSRFETEMSGIEEVPPIETPMHGKSDFKLESPTEMSFSLTVREGVKVTQAHIHCAPQNQNGPVVVHLIGMIPGGFDMDDKVADFTITDGNIVQGAGCTPAINNVTDLFNAMRNGNTYVNVHTLINPAGEIRGQIVSD